MRSNKFANTSTFQIRHNLRNIISNESAHMVRMSIPPNSPRFQQFADKLEIATQELERRGESWNG